MHDWLKKIEKFKSEAHTIFGVQENAKSRIVTLSESYESLNDLNVKQDDLFRQAFTCLEKECYRAAHVMAWAAFMDFLEEKIYEDGGVRVKNARPSWIASSPEELRETINEFQIVGTLQILGLCVKSERKALQGLLNKRNKCAHPTDYFPQLNDTLGYITELLSRVESLKKKSL